MSFRSGARAAQRRGDGLTRVDEFEARHVTETATQLRLRSIPVAERVAAGKLAIAGVTACVGVLAAFVPGRRAALMDPLVALRHD